MQRRYSLKALAAIATIAGLSSLPAHAQGTGKTRPDQGTVYFGSAIDRLRHNQPEIASPG